MQSDRIALLFVLTRVIMHPDLKQIQQAAEGLVARSESERPFKVFQVDTKLFPAEQDLLKIVNKPAGSIIENISFGIFFCSMTSFHTGVAAEEEKQINLSFNQLEEILKEKLRDVKVFRIGIIQVAVLIIGKLEDGSYGGLQTVLIET